MSPWPGSASRAVQSGSRTSEDTARRPPAQPLRSLPPRQARGERLPAKQRPGETHTDAMETQSEQTIRAQEVQVGGMGSSRGPGEATGPREEGWMLSSALPPLPPSATWTLAPDTETESDVTISLIVE